MEYRYVIIPTNVRNMRKLRNYRINLEEMVGFKVGKLTVTSFNEVRPRKNGIGNHYYYNCQCECGNTKIVTKQNLKLSKNKGLECSCNECLSKTVSKRNTEKPPKWDSIVDRKIALVLSDYTTRAIKKRVDITLLHGDFKSLCLSNCYYCNIEPTKYRTSDDKPSSGLMRLNFNGLDRIDSTKGYTKDNVVPCCEDCNKAKRNLKMDAFLDLIKQIYENRITQRYIIENL